jgi:hypothetical protein
MLKIATLCLGMVLLATDLAQAQDIAGIEDCTKASGLDKRTGCLQTNVNLLQQMLMKNALEARQRINAMQNELFALKATVASLQASLDQLQAAQKAGGEKKQDRR